VPKFRAAFQELVEELGENPEKAASPQEG